MSSLKQQLKKAANSQAHDDPKAAVAKQEKQSTINEKLVICLADLDRVHPSPCEWFDVWDKQGLTTKLISYLKDISQNTVQELRTGHSHTARLTVYGAWPGHSKIKKRPHFPDDWQWARLRLEGKVRVIGHLIGNKFYVVFLDKDHQFYPSER